jgi:hypothetical protein
MKTYISALAAAATCVIAQGVPDDQTNERNLTPDCASPQPDHGIF